MHSVCDSVYSYCVVCFFFVFKQKTAYEVRISDWSSDVCSSDLGGARVDDGVDLPVGPDHVDRGLADDLRAATVGERLAGTGVLETQGQCLGVDSDDLGVLGQVDPGHPSLHLGGLDDVGPQTAHVG